MRRLAWVFVTALAACYPEQPQRTGRLVFAADDCGVPVATPPLFENLAGSVDECACVEAAVRCVATGEPGLSITGRALWCADDSGECETHEGAYVCAAGEVQRQWVRGYTDTRLCSCSADCSSVVVGELVVGDVVTTCCK